MVTITNEATDESFTMDWGLDFRFSNCTMSVREAKKHLDIVSIRVARTHHKYTGVVNTMSGQYNFYIK